MNDVTRPEIWLVRHGETEWSAAGRHTGRANTPLTPTGVRQAEELARTIGARPFALVLTSPLARARETCRLAGQAGAAQVDDDLAEWDYGACSGRTTAEIRIDEPGWTVWSGALPGGETPEQVGERADRVLGRLRAAEGDVLLFGHGHMLRVLAARWVGLPPRGGRSFALDAASLSVLGFEREQPVIRAWNARPRLAQAP